MRADSWTQGDDERLRTFTERGWTAQQIADELGRTRAAIEKRISRLGLSAPRTIQRSLSGLSVGITTLVNVESNDADAVRRLVHSYATDLEDERLLVYRYHPEAAR